MPRIFISHSSKDREFVESELIPFLKREGVDPWYSRDDIEAASHWESTILQGLRECPWFMVILTPDAISSEWVQTEVSWALAERKGRVIPLLVRPCDVDELHLALRRIQWVDIVTDPELGWRNLQSLVGRFAGGGASPKRGAPASVAEGMGPAFAAEPPPSQDASDDRGEPGGETSRRLLDALLLKDFSSERFNDLAAPVPPVFGGMKFLVVDDEPFVRMLMTEMLTRYGAAVEVAGDGLEGLNLARTRDFDLIILDLMMPHIGGEEMVKELRKEGVPTLVVILSGYLSGGSRLRSLSPPVACFVSKPPDLKEFLSIIAEVVSADGLRAVLFQMGKFSADSFSTLRDCRSTVLRLRTKCADPNDLFQTALRHKAEDIVREAASRMSNGRDLGTCAEDLCKQLGSLESFWDRYQNGCELGLKGIVAGRMEEIPIESPAVSVSSMVDPAFDEFKVPSQVETLLVMAFLEFVGNALDALSGSGELRISLNRIRTRRSLFLSVWNDGERIPPNLADRIFDEGVSTKGRGRGMGLFIIDQLTRKLGGSVKLTQGNGVQFTLEIPEAAFRHLAE